MEIENKYKTKEEAYAAGAKAGFINGFEKALEIIISNCQRLKDKINGKKE